MAKREINREIDHVAALWAERIDARALTASEEAELDSWLGLDIRHPGAFARARAVLLRTKRAKALGTGFDPVSFSSESDAPTRRAVVVWGALAASAVLAAGVGLGMAPLRYRTRVGEVRVVALEDGSVVTLNTQTEIKVLLGKKLRRLELVDGEALFDVAKDSARPFIVIAGDMRVRAVGTSFSVRRLPDAPAEVLVREGVVEVARLSVDAPATRLGANGRAVLAKARPIEKAAVAPDDVGHQLAWRDGRISFTGQTLREAAAEFARYSDTRIVFEDSRIAELTVTGLYVSTDPVGFSRALAASFGLKAEVGDGQIRLTR